MSKYDFIKQGNLLFWHTADNDIECRIISTPEKVDSDSIILISTSSSETEVLASELLPIGSSRSHKEEFMRWKKEREAEGMEFFSRLSDNKRHTQTTLRQYCRRSFQLAKILHAAILLRLGDLRYPSALLLRTDRLHRSFPLYQYTGSGIRLGNGQTDH